MPYFNKCILPQYALSINYETYNIAEEYVHKFQYSVSMINCKNACKSLTSSNKKLKMYGFFPIEFELYG